MSINGEEALNKALSLRGVSTVLDVGCGDEVHAYTFRGAGKVVDTVSLKPPASFISDYLDLHLGKYDLIWACHVLEHQPNPNQFLKKCLNDLNDDGWLCITVPPMKKHIVGGHLNLYNAGLLLYQMILAGFNCKKAMVKQYGYNISVIVQKDLIELPRLDMDNGDIEALSEFFPFDAKNGFNGDICQINWD